MKLTLSRIGRFLVWLKFAFLIVLCEPFSLAQQTIALVGSGSSVPTLCGLHRSWNYLRHTCQASPRSCPLGLQGLSAVIRTTPGLISF